MGLTLSCPEAHGFVLFFWCGSGPVLCCFAVFLLAKRKSGGEICGSSLLPFFVCSLFHDASVVKPKSFMFFAHFFTASLIVRTEP